MHHPRTGGPALRAAGGGVVATLLRRARPPRAAAGPPRHPSEGGGPSEWTAAPAAPSRENSRTPTRHLCTAVPNPSHHPIASSTYMPPSRDDPSRPYLPAQAFPAPQPGVVRTLKAVSPFASHVETFVRAFPSFRPVAFHSVPRKALAATPLRRDLIHSAVLWQANMRRQGTAQTKHRTTVNASSRKTRAQKGTGKARAGDKTAPNFRKGGHAHNLWPREYTTNLSLKRQCLALRAALTAKFIQNQLIVVESLKETPPPGDRPALARPRQPKLTPQAALATYEQNKDLLRRRLEHFLEFNEHRNFVASKKPPREFVPQYVPTLNDIDAKFRMAVEFDRVLLCVSRKPEEEKQLADMEVRAGLRPPPDAKRPLGKYLDSYWNIWEAAHRSDKVEVCFANDLDCYRLMKYRAVIIEKDALDLVVDRTDIG